MATVYWQGGADAVAQVSTVQVTADDAATTYIITIGGKTVSVAGTGTGVNDTAAALKSALQAETQPYFANITYTSSGDTITMTATTAGVPFTATSSKSGGTGTIGAVATGTASSGPNDWSTANNWSTGSVPVNSDDVIIADGDVPIRWGLGQSAVTLTSLTTRNTYTGEIGLQYDVFATSSDGNTSSNDATQEYRETHLTIKATNTDIGENFGPGAASGSAMTNIDLDSTASTVVVHSTAPNGLRGGRWNAVNLLANSSSTAIHVRSANGGFGVAALVPGETSTIGSINHDSVDNNGSVQLSSGVTVTTMNNRGGTSEINAAGTITTVNCYGGILRSRGSYTVTTGNALGGTWFADHIGTAFTTLNVEGGTVDALNNSEARTWSTVNAKRGRIRADASVVTITTLNEGDSRPYDMQIAEA